VVAASHAQSLYDRCRSALGDDSFGVFVAEMTVASAVLFAPTVFMGATFAHLVQMAGEAGQASTLRSTATEDGSRLPPPRVRSEGGAGPIAPSCDTTPVGTGGTPALHCAR